MALYSIKKKKKKILDLKWLYEKSEKYRVGSDIQYAVF